MSTFNVQDFGASANGVTDAYAAVQAALNAAGAAGGGTVYMPAGTYFLSNMLVVPSNVTLEGAGPDTILLNPAGAVPGVTVNGTTWFATVGLIGANNASVQNLTIDHFTNGTTSDGVIMVPDGAGTKTTNSLIEGVTVKGYNTHQYLIWNLEGVGNTIANNTIIGNVPAGAPTEQEGIEIFGGQNVAVTGNNISSTGSDGIYIVENQSAAGVPGSNFSNILVQGNTVNGARSGIMVYADQTDSGVTIVDNQISNTLSKGIYVSSAATASLSGVLVENNTISNASGFGIWTEGQGSTNWSDVVLQNNIISGVGLNYGTGIDVNSTNTTVDANTISGASYSGISVSGAPDATVDGNTITNSGSLPLYVQISNSPGATLQANNVVSSGAATPNAAITLGANILNAANPSTSIAVSFSVAVPGFTSANLVLPAGVIASPLVSADGGETWTGTLLAPPGEAATGAVSLNLAGAWVNQSGNQVTIPASAPLSYDLASLGVAPVTTALFLTYRTYLDSLPGGFQIADTAANIAAQATTLGGDAQITAIHLTDSGTPGLMLTVAQLLQNNQRLVNEITTPFTISIADTAAAVSANFGALSSTPQIKSIELVDAGTPTLSLTLSQALTGGLLAKIINSSYAVAVSATAAAIEALTPAEITQLAGEHVVSLAVTDASVVLTVAEATQLQQAGIAIAAPSGDAVAASGTAATIAALSASEIGSLAANGVTGLVLTNAGIAFSVAQSAELASLAGFTITAPAGKHVIETFADGSLATFNFSASGSDYYAYDPAGLFTEIAHYDTSGHLLSEETFYAGTKVPKEIINNNITGGAFDATDYLYNAQGQVTSRTYYQGNHVLYEIYSIAADGTVTDRHFDASGAPSTTRITHTDGSYEYRTYSATGSVNSVYDSAGDQLAQTVYNAAGLVTDTYTDDGSGHYTFVARYDDSGNLLSSETLYPGSNTPQEIVTNNITGASFNSYDILYNPQGAVLRQTYYQGDHVLYEILSYAADGTVTDQHFNASGAPTTTRVTRTDGSYDYRAYSYSAGSLTGSVDSAYDNAGNLIGETVYNAAGLATSGYNWSSAGNLTQITNYDASGNIASTETFYAPSETPEEIIAYNVTGAPFDSYAILYNQQGAEVSQTYYQGNHVLYEIRSFAADGTVTDQHFDATGAPTTTRITRTNGSYDYRVYDYSAGSLNGSVDNAYDSAGNLVGETVYNAAGAVTDAYAWDSSGNYTAVAHYDSGGNLLSSETFYPGTSNPLEIVIVGLHGVDSNDANKTYSKIEEIYTPAGAISTLELYHDDGTNLIESLSPGATLTATSTTDVLYAYASGTTLAFHDGFGVDTVTSFLASGTGADTLQFDATMFNYLNPGMSQADAAAAVLGHATQNAGGSAVITDSFGDSVTLQGIGLHTLSANLSSFKFI
jgi:antitoxin component YwqK of YwqJK toxin-antitoxin module